MTARDPQSGPSNVADQGSPALSAEILERGRLIFAGPCDFFHASTSMASLPATSLPEIAFAGRSNVGKSSLLNALTGRNSLARVSHTPGRTQQLNFFALGTHLHLVDMPGYGYAAVSKDKITGWSTLIRDFLRGRATLARVFVLVDGRHGLKANDDAMLAQLDASALSYQIVLTKRDEVMLADIPKRIEETLARLRPHPAAYPHVLFTSSKTGEGIAELRGSIAQMLAERGL